MSKVSEENRRQLAAELFNGTWDLLDQADRSPEEDLMMIHRAHASRCLWESVGQDQQRSTGEWQVSHVYAVLGEGQGALRHGQAALRYCESGQLKPFDYAFAHEAIARALSVLGDKAGSAEHLEKARGYTTQVAEADDREYLLRELATIG